MIRTIIKSGLGRWAGLLVEHAQERPVVGPLELQRVAAAGRRGAEDLNA